jgi:hypothetical protein
MAPTADEIAMAATLNILATAVAIGPVVPLSSLLQQYAGFPDRIIGEILGARGHGLVPPNA